MAAAQLQKDIEQPAAAAQQDEQQSGYQVISSCYAPLVFPAAVQPLSLAARPVRALALCAGSLTSSFARVSSRRARSPASPSQGPRAV